MDNIINISFTEKMRAYFDLTKFRLSITVVFSSCFGFTLASNEVNYFHLVLFGIASFSITAAANIINQIKEIELDKLMSRTENRPLPSGRLSISEAIIFGIFLGIFGIGLPVEALDLLEKNKDLIEIDKKEKASNKELSEELLLKKMQIKLLTV